MNKKPVPGAVAAALDTIKKFNMLSEGDSVLISVSGGPDSVFLTRFFIILRDELRLKLYGFSLDHSTRNGESASDLKFVKDMYKDLGIKLFSRKVDVGKWCAEHGLSFQEGARSVRQDLLERIAEDNDINKIALGHNLDDNIETFMMRIIRGSGARGLAGIRPVDGKVIRPLLETSREDIEDYLEAEGISFCIDSSNLEDKYTRNRIRNRLIPYIQKNFPGDLTGSIKRIVDILRDEDDFLAGYSSAALKKDAVISESGGKAVYIKIPAGALKGYSPAIARRVIRAAFTNMLGSTEDISYVNIGDILDLAVGNGGESKWLRPAAEVMVFKIGDYIHMAETGHLDSLDPDIRSYIKEKSGEKAEEASEQAIIIGGSTALEGFGFSVRTELVSGLMDYNEFPASRAILDYGKIVPPVKVRRWLEGDRFHPLGMEGSKKLQDFFTDNKVPVNMRDRIPVFCDREKIIWIGNMRIDSRVKVTAGTTEFLYLELYEK